MKAEFSVENAGFSNVGWKVRTGSVLPTTLKKQKNLSSLLPNSDYVIF